MTDQENYWAVHRAPGWDYLRRNFRPIEDVSHKGKPLREILNDHKKWIESDGGEGAKGDLRGADLREVYLKGSELERIDFGEALLQEAYLGHARLISANLQGADLRRANFQPANLLRANLIGADLREANLEDSVLVHANLEIANLQSARLPGAWLRYANLRKVDLQGANLQGANLSDSNMQQANLKGADLHYANMGYADLREANLSGADLSEASLHGANLRHADISGCRVYGVSAWRVVLDGANQSNLVITLPTEPSTTVDNLELAHFIYLLLHDKNVRNLIDTITSKVVLILGRFTSERMAILEAIREELRKRDYLPVLFDFDKPINRDLTETVSTLAHMARFIIVDITEPRSVPHELATIVPTLAIPIQPLLLEGTTGEYAMFSDLSKYQWVLRIFHYRSSEALIASINENVIAPAEDMVDQLRRAKGK